MDINGKLDILKLIDAKVSYAQIADRFKCSVRFLATVKSDRKKIEAAAAAGAGSQKTARKAEFHEVSYTSSCCCCELDIYKSKLMLLLKV